MNNKKEYISKKHPKAKLKNLTAALIVSAALILSFEQMSYACVSDSAECLKNCIYLAYREKVLSASDVSENKKRKSYTADSRFEILSLLTGESSDRIKELVKNGETLQSIADEYGILNEYNFLVLRAYNYGLENLYRNGKLSEEEYISMYNNADLSFINSCDTKPNIRNAAYNSGNITSLLAGIIGKPESEVEKMLTEGKNPWKIAASFGKFSELKDLVFENTLSYIDTMLENGKITQSDADDIISDFENSFLSKINSH